MRTCARYIAVLTPPLLLAWLASGCAPLLPRPMDVDETEAFDPSQAQIQVSVRTVALSGDEVADAASGVTYRTFGATIINNAGQIAFEAEIAGGETNVANNTGLWFGHPDNLTLVVREGDQVSDDPEVVFDDLSGGGLTLADDSGQVLTSLFLPGGFANLFYGTTDNLRLLGSIARFGLSPGGIMAALVPDSLNAGVGGYFVGDPADFVLPSTPVAVSEDAPAPGTEDGGAMVKSCGWSMIRRPRF